MKTFKKDMAELQLQLAKLMQPKQAIVELERLISNG